MITFVFLAFLVLQLNKLVFSSEVLKRRTLETIKINDFVDSTQFEINRLNLLKYFQFLDRIVGITCHEGRARSHYCSDFRYESNGIFVLGVGFFSSDKFRLFN